VGKWLKQNILGLIAVILAAIQVGQNAARQQSVPAPHSGNLPWGWIIVGLLLLASALINTFGFKFQRREPKITKEQIYIGPVGMPLQIQGKKAILTLAILSCATVRLLSIKAYLGDSPHAMSISDIDVHDIKSLDVFKGSIEQKLDDDELAALASSYVRVQGTAKFDNGVEATFDFLALPFRT
jgi:hypothetical protein